MTDEIIVESVGALGRIRLNRPKALNALTHGMVLAIDGALDRFQRDPAVAAVLLTGEGERGLCAGGDLRGFHDSDDASFGETFWRDEYRLDARIARYEKPFVALMDGIVMGGGVGVSAHARVRVVTERSRIATPETGIGLLPDVGATWLLPRAPGETGTYIGLVGEPIGAVDAIYAGLADAFVSSDAIGDLVAALAALPERAGELAVREAVAAHERAAGPAALEAARDAIDRCFDFDTVQDILAALAREGTEFAAATRATLLKRSPTSLVLTLRLLRLGRSAASLEDCLEREYRGVLGTLREGDFREGIRAVVVDKDRNPRWSPATIDDVDPAMIERWIAADASPVFARSREMSG